MIINPESFGFRNSRIFVDLVIGIIHFLIDTATAPLELRAPLKPLSGSGERLSGAKVFFSIPLFSLQPFTSSRFFFSFFFLPSHSKPCTFTLCIFFFRSLPSWLFRSCTTHFIGEKPCYRFAIVFHFFTKMEFSFSFFFLVILRMIFIYLSVWMR